MSTARYQNIVYVFRTQIASGALKPGDRLPSIAEMEATFDVSAATVRQARLTLRTLGLTYGRSGVGMFVALPGGQPVDGGGAMRFQGVVDEIKRRVACGELRPGDRLPSYKELGTVLGASPSAVREAFIVLKAQRVVEPGVEGMRVLGCPEA